MIKLLLIVLIVVPFNTFSQREYVDTLGFKSVVLSELIIKRINSERKKKKVDSLFYNRQLREMTINHVEYMAENNFIGVSCGIMDQFAVGMGKKDNAILLNCNTLEYEYVPIFLKKASIVIMNTNKRRGLADSKYNERRICRSKFLF